MGDDNDWKKASTEEKIEHKNWKARLEGYEECCKLFRAADDPKNPIYLNYLGLVKKFVVDSNEVAKDKALDAVLAFVENIPAASKTAGEVLPGLINKCLNGKAKTKEKAFEIILMYIEAEKQEIVQEELIKGLENKQPKIVQACLEILRRAINEFSSKTIPIKPIIKFVPKLLEDRDKMVRDETKLLAVEMYRWAGQAIMPQLQGIKPVLLEELETEFKNAASGEKPRQTRFLRSQQDLKAKMEAEMEQRAMNGGGGAGGDMVDGTGAGDQEAAPENIDPYDLMEPAEILSKLPKDFKEKLEAKKWQERKEVLDNLLAILQKNPRLMITDYYELVNDLKKVVGKDSNVNIVVVAAKCITGIANGIRKDFSKYAIMCLEPLMERFKEKKQNIVDALREACDAIYPSTNLEVIQEMCVGFLGHKTPVVRQQVALFLAKCFAMSTQTTLPKKILKLYLPPLIKNLSEADPSVRDSSAEALGAIYKALGEKIFVPQVPDLETAKMDKIKEFAEKVVLLNLRGEPRVVANAAAAPRAAPAPAAEEKKKPTIVKPDANKPAAKPGPSADAKKEAPAKKVVKGGGGGADKKEEKKLPEEPDLAQETVDERAVELFGAECVNNLASSNWKERQTSLESIAGALKRMVPEDTPVQVIARTLAKKPGFKDSHFQVLKQRLELVTQLAETGFKFSQRTASYCLVDIADKIGDVKTSQQAKDALSKIADQCTLPYVCTQVLNSIFEAKNPKNQENALLWLCQAIKEFGFQGLETKLLLNYTKSAIQNSNASVRLASVQLISVIFMYVGQNFRSLFDQEKPALLEQIDAEIEKVKAMKPPVPIRGRNVPKAGGGGGGGGSGDGEANEDEDTTDPIQMQLQQEALMPRTDISSQLTDALIEQMNDKNWKERQAALEKLEQILRDNKFIEPNLNEFPTNLNKRLTDTNKILATTALKIAEKLAQALGSQGRRFVSVLAPGMIAALADNKETLRKSAVAALNAWFDSCGGLAPFIEGDLLAESFTAATNPNIKAELCGWLSSVLSKSKPGKLPPELKAIVPSVFNYVEDRNPDVRSKAQELIMPLMMHVGNNEMLRAMNKTKPTSITILQPLLEKAKAEIAAKQPAPAPAAVAKPKPAAAAKARNLYEDSPEETETPPPVAAPAKKEPAKVNGKGGKEKEKEKEANEKPANGKANGPAATTSSKKKNNDDEDLGPVMQVSNKNKRIDDEKGLKTLKWNFDVPRKEFIDQLKTQMETANFNKTLQTQLFHDDFKYHIIALQTLSKAVDDLTDATISNLDLILRWLTLRFFETNPTVILKAIDYMKALFNMLAQKNYHLHEFEANAFVPYFIGKLGDPKDQIRKGFREIIKQIAQVFAPVKIFNFLVQGLASKNSRQRAECLEECGQMIEMLGLTPFNPSVTLKEIAKQIGDRDTSVRNAALNTVTIAFQIQGEQVYKYIGKLNEKDLSMLEERKKRSVPKIPPAGVKGSQSGQLNQTQATSANIPNSTSLNSLSSAVSNQHLNQQLQQHSNGHSGMGGPVNMTEASMGGIGSSATITRPTARYNTTPRKGQSLTQQIVSSNANTSPNTSGPGMVTKQKGQFTLDIKDDDDDRDGFIPVKLTPHQDLDELLNKPIDLPPPRKNLTTYPVNILKESQDCKEAIDLVITHISHQDIHISIQNLLQIDVVIRDKEKKDLLIPHIDNLLNTCAVKLNVAHNVYLCNHDCQVELVFKLFKGIFSVLMDLFDSGLGKNACVKSLRDVFYNLLSVMTDSKVVNYPDGDQLIRAINLVTLKLLEFSNQTTCYCALVKLLSECCDQDNLSSKYLELVMKCIWRQIRRLSPQSSSTTNPNSTNNTSTMSQPSSSNPINQMLIQQIDTSKVLNEIHLFLKQYPSSSWPKKQSDLPLRTVKTLVFHLAKGKQLQIIDDLNSINIPDDSELKIYVMKLIKNGFQLNQANQSHVNQSKLNQTTTSPTNNTTTNMLTSPSNNNFGFGSARLTSSNASRLAPSGIKSSSQIILTNSNPAAARTQQLTRELNDQLSCIMKKISNSEQSKEGLRELYDFKQQYPDLDLEKYYKNSTGKLKSYIDENLKLIEMEKQNSSPNSCSSQSSTSSSTNKQHLAYQSNLSPELLVGSSAKSMAANRNVDDIMKTIADWKSRTQLNKLDDDDNDENNLRTNNNSNISATGSGAMNGGAGDMSDTLAANSFRLNHHGALGLSSNRLFQNYQANSNSKLFLNESENSIKAEKYLDIVKDLKKKYTRSRTENLNENSSSTTMTTPNNTNNSMTPQHSMTQQSPRDQIQPQSNGGGDSTNTNYAQMPSENLYDEYKRRLDLIKNIKKVK